MNDYFKQLQLQKLLSDLTLQIEWYQSLNSTNLKAADQINSALQTPVVIISNQQTSGYGKRGRQFISKPGGLYLSLLTPIHNLNNDNIGLLTTGIVAVLQQSINQYWQINCQIKWVNDLLFKHQKIAGILVEHPTSQLVIIGIGLNLYQKDLTATLPQAANLLAYIPKNIEIVQFTALLIRNLLEFLPDFSKSCYLNLYRQHLILLNKAVQIQLGHKVITGQVTDIDDKGNLLLKTKTGITSLSMGEVTKVNWNSKT